MKKFLREFISSADNRTIFYLNTDYMDNKGYLETIFCPVILSPGVNISQVNPMNPLPSQMQIDLFNVFIDDDDLAIGQWVSLTPDEARKTHTYVKNLLLSYLKRQLSNAPSPC